MYRKEKKIPTLLAIIVLFSAIAGVAYYEQSSQSLTSQASQSSTPQDVHFTNITDNSITVSWITEKKVIQSISVSTNNLIKQTFLDDLDSDNIPKPRKTHYVTLKNLEENTTYELNIVSNKCKEEKTCPKYSQKTASKIMTNISIAPPHGKILNRDGSEAQYVIVYLIIENSSPLSTRTDSSGLWVIPLSNLISTNLSEPPLLSDKTIVQIDIQASPSDTASAVTDIKSIKQDLTIPDITIGNSYNFVDLLSKKDLIASKNMSKILGTNNKIPQQNMSDKNLKNHEVKLIFPDENNTTTSDNQPRIKGAGIPGSQVLITINSTPQTGRITVDDTGTWTWRPPEKLTPGIHHVSIQSYNEFGELVKIKKQLIVLKSGESVLGEATPSASHTPTATIKPTTTPTMTPKQVTSSPIPTITASIATPTVKPPTFTPQPLPRAGINKPAYLMLGGSLSLLLIGIKLLIF